MFMLKGKKILLGVSGGIAAYKSAALASALVKLGCGVSVLMTRSAQEFITPLTFEAITGRRVHTDTFDRGDPSKVQHIALADEAIARQLTDKQVVKVIFVKGRLINLIVR